MATFRADYIILAIDTLERMERMASENKNKPEVTEFFDVVALSILNMSKHFDLDDIAARVQALKDSAKDGRDLSHQPINLAHELKTMRELLLAALHNRFLMFIPPHKAKVLFGDAWFSKEASMQFPEAKDDMMSARMCYAAGQDTASIFHSVRVAEYGMRRLARRLDVKTKHPLKFEEWGKVLDAIEKKLTALRVSQRGSKRERQIQFFSSAFRHLQFLNDLWRREIAHARSSAPYSEHQALDALQHVRGLMDLLAHGLMPRRAEQTDAIKPAE